MMRKPSDILVVVIMSVICLMAAAAKSMERFEAPEGFSFLMEGTPETPPTSLGSIKTYQHSSKDSSFIYWIMISDVMCSSDSPPSVVTGAIDGACTGMVIGTKANEIQRKSITLDSKFPGREVETSFTQGSATGYYRARIYLVKHRMFQLFVGSTEERTLHNTEANQFLESLRVSPEKWK